MSLTEKQTQLARTIDTHVAQIIAHGGGDEELLRSMADHMPTFKKLMGLSTQGDMDALSQQYHGFYRYAILLERLAEGIANGSIPVPK